MPNLKGSMIAGGRYSSKRKGSRSRSAGRRKRSRSRSRGKKRDRSESPGEAALQKRLEARRKKFASPPAGPKKGEKGHGEKRHGEKAKSPSKSKPPESKKKPLAMKPAVKMAKKAAVKVVPKVVDDEDIWEEPGNTPPSSPKPKATKASSPAAMKPPLKPKPPLKLSTTPATLPPPKPAAGPQGGKTNPIEVTDEIPKSGTANKAPGTQLTMPEKLKEYGLDVTGSTSDKMKRIKKFEKDKFSYPETKLMTVKEIKKWITEKGGNIKSCPDKKSCCALALKMYKANQEVHIKAEAKEDKFDVMSIYTIDVDKMVTTKIKALIVNLGGDPSICFLKSDYAKLAKELVEKKKKGIDPADLFAKLKSLDKNVLKEEYCSDEFGWDTEAILDDIKLSEERAEKEKKEAFEKARKEQEERARKRKAAQQLHLRPAKKQKVVPKKKVPKKEAPLPVYPMVGPAGSTTMRLQIMKDARGVFGIKDISEDCVVNRVIGTAACAGLWHNDKIVQVNGKSVSNKKECLAAFKTDKHYAEVIIARTDRVQVFECVQANVAYRKSQKEVDRIDDIQPLKRREQVEVLEWKENWALGTNGYWLPTFSNNLNVLKQLHHSMNTLSWDLATSLGVKVKWMPSKEPEILQVIDKKGMLAGKVSKGDSLAYLGDHSLKGVIESKFRKILDFYKEEPCTNFQEGKAGNPLSLRIRRKFTTTPNGTVKLSV